mgnify:CR=1 FL=1
MGNVIRWCVGFGSVRVDVIFWVVRPFSLISVCVALILDVGPLISMPRALILAAGALIVQTTPWKSVYFLFKCR